MQITAEMILEKDPCVEWVCKLKKEFAGQSKSLLEILKMESIQSKDRIWVATKFLDDKTNRLFAVWCAREALKLVENPDPRSIAACDVAERFATSEATKKELSAAWSAAWSAAGSAAWSAAGSAAGSAAWSAAWSAAGSAARSAAVSAARSAESAARSAQVKKLIELVGSEP